jgi:hypothetical protein
MINYIELYQKMVPKLSIEELTRQKKSFENDINLPFFSSSREATILKIITNRIEEIS